MQYSVEFGFIFSLSLVMNTFTHADIHIGSEIKKIAKGIHMGPTELGRILSMSKQNVYGIYKRKSIDTALLHKIGLALKYDFFTFYYSPSKPMDKGLVHELKEFKKKYELLKALYETKNGNKIPGSLA